MNGKDNSNLQQTNNENLLSQWVPSVNPWLIALSVMLPTFMVILDSSIVNVAVPHIAGSFSATQEESTWVLTSYLVANGVILPSTDWFSTLFGRKKFLLICIIVFTFSSLLCGIAISMPILIGARILQGLGGGAIMPITQAILLESFKKEQRGVAMSIFGLGIIVAPILGPSLGGWITDTYSWHWIFFINIPIGILALYLGGLWIEDPPYARKGEVQKIDYFGFLLLIVWLFSLQIVLDNGQKSDWFDARWVRWTSAISLSCFIGFIWWELKNKNPIIRLKVFLDRNFFVGTLIIGVIGALLYSTLAILPLFLQHLLGYSATASGLAISSRGFGSLIGIGITAYFANRIDQRFVVSLGLVLLGISSLMFGSLNMEISMSSLIIPNVICGIAFSAAFVPLMTIAFATLSNNELTNSSGIFNLAKNVGGAIGISIVSTMIIRLGQIHQTYLVKNLTSSNQAFVERLSAFQSAMFGFGSNVAEQKAGYLLYSQLLAQSNLLAYMGCFKIYAVVSFLIVPLVFLFKKTSYRKLK